MAQFNFEDDKKTRELILVHHKDGKFVGQIYKLADGYYYFDLDAGCTGCWSSWTLLELGQKLRELNAHWDAEVCQKEGEKNAR